MYRWIVAAALLVGVPSLVALYLKRHQKQTHTQRVSIETFANKLVTAAGLRAPYRDAVAAYIAKSYAQKRKIPLHRRHPSFVLLYMAKHPCVQKHLCNTMATCDTELEQVKHEHKSAYKTLLQGKISYYAHLLMDGFDTFNAGELTIDASGKLTAVRGTRFNYCLPIDQQPSFYPPHYTRLFNVAIQPMPQNRMPQSKSVA